MALTAEFTDSVDKKKRRRDKWLFTRTDEPSFCFGGIWRSDKDVGEVFTILTTRPGPDITPYPDRHIAIVDRADWGAWLDPSVSAKMILKPLPSGALTVAATPISTLEVVGSHAGMGALMQRD